MNNSYKGLNLDILNQKYDFIEKLKPQINIAQAIKPQLELSDTMREITHSIYAPILDNAEFQLKISELIKPINIELFNSTKIINELLASQRLYNTDLINSINSAIDIPKTEIFKSLKYLERELENSYTAVNQPTTISNEKKLAKISKAFTLGVTNFGEGFVASVTGEIPANILNHWWNNEPLYITEYTNIAFVLLFILYSFRMVNENY